DVRTLHVVQIPALNAHQLREPVSLRRMDYTDVIEVAVARLQDISLCRLDQGRLVTFTLLDDAPVGHLGIADGQAVDCPTGAVIVRRAVSGVLVNMSANAKAELRIL